MSVFRILDAMKRMEKHLDRMAEITDETNQLCDIIDNVRRCAEARTRDYPEVEVEND